MGKDIELPNGSTRRIKLGILAFLAFVAMLLMTAVALAAMGFPELSGVLIKMIPTWGA